MADGGRDGGGPGGPPRLESRQMATLWDIAAAGWRIWNETAPYVLLGFVLAGLLHVSRIGTRLLRYMRRDDSRSVLLAAMVGIPLPLCSCGVLPTALGLRRQGAGKGAVVSFLVATPETGATSIAMTYGLLGPLVAVFRPIAALITAVTAGVLVNVFDRTPPGSPPAADASANAASSTPSEASGHWIRRLYRFTFVDLLDDLIGWVVLGVAVSAVIQVVAPPSFFEAVSANAFYAMLLMLAISVPLYVCAEASTPIAASLIAQGLNPGAALVMLLAGPATNAGAVGALWRQLGRRAVTIYLASIVTISLAMGGALNAVLDLADVNLVGRVQEACAHAPGPWRTAASVVLLGLTLVSAARTRPDRRLVAWVARRLRAPAPESAPASACGCCHGKAASASPVEDEERQCH